jgi:hypothetical protein
MAFKRVLAGAGRVPDLDAVPTSGRKKLAVGREGHRNDPMPAKPKKK